MGFRKRSQRSTSSCDAGLGAFRATVGAYQPGFELLLLFLLQHSVALRWRTELHGLDMRKRIVPRDSNSRYQTDSDRAVVPGSVRSDE